MKQATIGYITAMINNQERYINWLNSVKTDANETKKYENFKNELCDLLDFVIDIPEENKEPITVVLNWKEVEELKKKIRELEESCQLNNEVISSQFNQTKELKENNCMWQNVCNDLREKNESLQEKLKALEVKNE